MKEADRFEQYYTRFFKEIYFYELSGIKDASLAEEFTQEIFVKLWENMDKIQSEEHAANWLYKVAKNLNANYFRDLERRPKQEDYEEEKRRREKYPIPRGARTEEKCLNLLCLEKIAVYLREMNEMDQKIFWCWQSEEGWEELSRETGRTVHALQCKATRLVKKLRKKFGDERA